MKLRIGNKVILLLIICYFVGLSIINIYAVPKKCISLPMKNIVIDGKIDETEWADVNWKVEFFLYIDDISEVQKSDGYNYLYLGEDLDNLYIGLDLCSDQIYEVSNEWIGLWLNLNNRNFINYFEWSNFINNGAESLIFNVQDDKVWPFFDPRGHLFSYEDFNNNNEYNIVLGTTEGSYLDFDSSSGTFFNIHSEANNTHNIIWIDFSVNTTKWFDIFPELFAGVVRRVLIGIACRANTTISSNEIIFWYNNGTWNKNDPNQVRSINTRTFFRPDFIIYNATNLTADCKMQFSLYANHSEPFSLQFDYLQFTVHFDDINRPESTISFPFTSINNFEIKWDFNTSANSASNHLMFEFKIPKSELEHYNSNTGLGILVGGYRTTSLVGSNYWVYSKFTDYFNEEKSRDYYYYNMKGCSVPSSSLIITRYDIFFVIGAISVLSIISFKRCNRSLSKTRTFQYRT